MIIKVIRWRVATSDSKTYFSITVRWKAGKKKKIIAFSMQFQKSSTDVFKSKSWLCSIYLSTENEIIFLIQDIWYLQFYKS